MVKEESREDMTREQALDIVKEFPTALQDAIDHDGYGDASFDKEQARWDVIALNMAIKALEQEPVLDKIRAEIADIYCGQYCESPLTADAVREMALEIIDKYKADMRGEEV